MPNENGQTPNDDTIPGHTQENPVTTNENLVQIPPKDRQSIWGRRASERPVLVEWRPDHTPGRRWELESDDVTIGRDDDCDLAIHTEQISRRHLRVYRSDGHYLIEDLNSRNGTWINGERLAAPRRIKDGDEINVALVLRLIFLGGTSA